MAAIADSTSFRTTGYVRDLARRLGLTGFGRWWARELAALMPARIRTALEHRRARPVLAFDGSRATLWRPAQTNGRLMMIEVAGVPLDGDPQAVTAGGRAALASLARTPNGDPPEVVVALPTRMSLRKTFALPAVVEPNLHQTLAFDLDRHTPFKADELYFDAAVVDRDTARNTLRVELAAARRALVDPMLRFAESFGARVVAISVDPPAAAAASPLNLLPEDRRVAEAAWTRWQVLVPLAILVAGAVAALALPVWQKRQEAIALGQLSEEARQRATISDALRTELERKVGDYNFVLERKYAFPGAVQALDDITRLLPDDTWLTQLELRSVRGKDGQRELALRGESANAGQLVSLLEDSKVFTQAAPRSPTTKIQPGPGEIFDVGAQLKPQPAPPALPLDATARAEPAPPSRRPPAAAAPAAPPAAAVPPVTGSEPAALAPGVVPSAGNAAPPVDAPPTRRTRQSVPPTPGVPARALAPRAPATPAPGEPAIVPAPANTPPQPAESDATDDSSTDGESTTE